MIILRDVHSDDSELLFNWANDDIVRINSISTDKIEMKNHLSWLKNKISHVDTIMYIGEFQHLPIGQIRFDLIDGRFYVDYSIDKKYRKKGLGSILVRNGLKKIYELYGNKYIIEAHVKHTNIASWMVFKKNCFNEKQSIKINNTNLIVFELINLNKFI